jgi:hypothetical protein
LLTQAERAELEREERREKEKEQHAAKVKAEAAAALRLKQRKADAEAAKAKAKHAKQQQSQHAKPASAQEKQQHKAAAAASSSSDIRPRLLRKSGSAGKPSQQQQAVPAHKPRFSSGGSSKHHRDEPASGWSCPRFELWAAAVADACWLACVRAEAEYQGGSASESDSEYGGQHSGGKSASEDGEFQGSGADSQHEQAAASHSGNVFEAVQAGSDGERLLSALDGPCCCLARSCCGGAHVFRSCSRGFLLAGLRHEAFPHQYHFFCVR